MKVITNIGPMFCDKSTKCILKYIKLVKVFKQKCIIVKPEIDTKNKDYIKSRNGLKIKAENIKSLSDILEKIIKEKYDNIFVDECQFFKLEDVKLFLNQLKDTNITIYFYGLNFNYLKSQWETTQYLYTISDKFNELYSFCYICKSKTRFTCKIKGDKNNIISIDGENGNKYEPRCLQHFLI